MSQANVKIAKALTDAFNAGDMDTYGGLLARDVIWRVTPDWPEPGPYVGRKALRDTVQADLQDFCGGRYQASEICAVGAHHVLCLGQWGGIGAASQMELYTSVSVPFTVRDGVITRAEFYRDHQDALKAAGSRSRSSCQRDLRPAQTIQANASNIA